MKCITVINQKGGVGKTTTAANLGVALARRGRRVLLIDLDPQAHLTIHLGVEPEGDQPNCYTLLTLQQAIADIRQSVEERLHLVPSHLDLAAAEHELVSIIGRETLLHDALHEVAEDHDYAIVDCPPSLGVLTLNGLCAADEVLIPMQAHFLALQGVSKLLETIQLVHRRVNPRIRVTGVLLCMYEASTRLGSEVAQDLQNFLLASRGGNTPWSQARLFRSFIRRNIKLAECPSHGLSVFDYAQSSHGAEDYARLADELLTLYEAPPEAIDSPDSCFNAASPAEREIEPASPEAARNSDALTQQEPVADDLLVNSSASVELRSIENPDEMPPPASAVDAPVEDEAVVPSVGQQCDELRSGECGVEPTRPFARFSDVASPDHGRDSKQSDAASASPVDQLRDLCSLREIAHDPSASSENPAAATAPHADDAIEPCRQFAFVPSSAEERHSDALAETGERAGCDDTEPDHSIPDAPAPPGAHLQDPDSATDAPANVESAPIQNPPVMERSASQLPQLAEMPAAIHRGAEAGAATGDDEPSEPFRPIATP